MRQAVEGSLVTASAADPAIDWAASGTTAEEWREGVDSTTLDLKANEGSEIVQFRYRTLTDGERIELTRYFLREEDAVANRLVAFHKAYELAVFEVKRGGRLLKRIDIDHQIAVGRRIWNSSQLTGQDLDF